MDALAGKKLRILVGLHARLTPEGEPREDERGAQGSRREVRECFYEELVRTLNRADDFGLKQMEESYGLLKEKAKCGDLEIRQTKEPCHAKLYVFHYNADLQKLGHLGVAVMGSSNLSAAGLQDRMEINRRFADNEPYEAGKKIFDAMWEEAIPLVDEHHYDEFVKHVVIFLKMRVRTVYLY